MAEDRDVSTEASIRYRVLDEVLAEIDQLETEDPSTIDAFRRLRVRLLKSGGVADPSRDPRLKKP